MIETFNTENKVFLEKGILYIVSTPIGNLNDLSIRATITLRFIDIILCEDTRITKKLLDKHKIYKKKLISYNDYNGKSKRPKLINNLLSKSFNYALVSDSGTPLISDPGYKLVRECLENNIKVTHVPGASSVISALILSGLPSNQFYFGGFLEKNKNKKTKQLIDIKFLKTTSIWFESGKRILSSILLIDQILEGRRISVLKELTKLNETLFYGKTSNILDKLKSHKMIKGEFILVVEGIQSVEPNETEIERLINKHKDKTTKDLVKFLVDKTGMSKKFIYNKVIKLTNK